MWKNILQWFIGKAWPVILDFIKKYQGQIMQLIFKWIEDILLKRRESTKQEFQTKANEADQKARDSADKESKVKYQTQADTYREVINALEIQNKKLQDEIKEIKIKIKKEMEENTSALRVEDLFNTNKKGEITVKENDNYIQLPPPSS